MGHDVLTAEGGTFATIVLLGETNEASTDGQSLSWDCGDDSRDHGGFGDDVLTVTDGTMISR